MCMFNTCLYCGTLLLAYVKSVDLLRNLHALDCTNHREKVCKFRTAISMDRAFANIRKGLHSSRPDQKSYLVNEYFYVTSKVVYCTVRAIKVDDKIQWIWFNALRHCWLVSAVCMRALCKTRITPFSLKKK